MGQKVNPHGMRVGVIKDWDSRWYAEADFADNLIEDHKIRTYLKKRDVYKRQIRIVIGFAVHNGFQTAMEEKNLQTKTAAEG